MKKMSFFQQIVYALPEGVSQLIISLVGFYAMFFYSDVLRINPALVGTIFFVARIISCITDPAVGTFLDTRKPLRSGKFTPYLIFGCVLMAITTTLIFMAPDVSMVGKIFYVIVTYNLYNIAYSFFEVPYGGLLTTLTNDYDEVNRAGSIRSFMGVVGMTIFGYLSDFLLSTFAGLDGLVNEYTLTGLVFGLAIMVAGLMIRRFVREQIQAAPEKQEERGEGKTKVGDVIRVALSNKPLIIVVVVNLLTNTAWLLRDSATIYFFQYTMGRGDLLALYIAISGFAQLPIIALLPKLNAKFGNKKIVVAATLISLVSFGVLYVGMNGSIVLVILAAALSALGWSVFYGLMFGMIANTVEYGEWKNGVRAAGVSTSLPLLAFKLAMGLSSLILGFLLEFGGYVPDAVQSATAIGAINTAFIYLPAALAVLWLIAILFYDLDKKYPTIIKELEERKGKKS